MIYSFEFTTVDKSAPAQGKPATYSTSPVHLDEQQRLAVMPAWRAMKKYARNAKNQNQNGQPTDRVFTTYLKLANVIKERKLSCDNFCELGGGPGSMSLYLLSRHATCRGTGITLADKDKHWTWFESLRANPRFTALEGDLMSDVAVDMLREHGPYDLVIADAGEDSSVRQESTSFGMLAAEARLATQIVCLGGNYIMKIYDTFLLETQTMLWSLAHVFDKIVITHGVAVRVTNSERYLVCAGYKGLAADIPDDFSSAFVKFLDKANNRAVELRHSCELATTMGFDAMPESISELDAIKYFDGL